MRRAVAVLTMVAVVITVTAVSSAWADERVDRAAKGTSLTFRAASTTPSADFQKMTIRDGGTVYVSSRAALMPKEVISAKTADGREGAKMELSLTPEASQRLATMLRNKEMDRLAIFSGSRLVAAAELGPITPEGRVTLTGLAPNLASRLSEQISRKEPLTGTMVTVVPRQASGVAGDQFTFDVFIEDLSTLKTYQVMLVAADGDNGSLVRETLWVDADRSDYVFGSRQVVKAADEQGGRLGGVVMEGAVPVTGSAYLGSFTFTASSDARGTFTVDVSPDDNTFFRDAKDEQVIFRSTPATITLGR